MLDTHHSTEFGRCQGAEAKSWYLSSYPKSKGNCKADIITSLLSFSSCENGKERHQGPMEMTGEPLQKEEASTEYIFQALEILTMT